MKFYFVRHGESVANVEKVISNRGFQHPLTTLGREQVMQLADKLYDDSITHIYSSPLQRAVQTAEILAESKGLAYVVSDALREGDCGLMEGRGDERAWFWVERLWENWIEDNNFDAKIEGGESYNDMMARFLPFITKLIYSHADSDSVLLVGHGALYKVCLANILQNIDHSFAISNEIDNACAIKAYTTADGLVCTEWCGVEIA